MVHMRALLKVMSGYCVNGSVIFNRQRQAMELGGGGSFSRQARRTKGRKQRTGDNDGLQN